MKTTAAKALQTSELVREAIAACNRLRRFTGAAGHDVAKRLGVPACRLHDAMAATSLLTWGAHLGELDEAKRVLKQRYPADVDVLRFAVDTVSRFDVMAPKLRELAATKVH